MKIRADYVSNSSSSSFVVSLPKDMALNAFIDDVAKACIEKQDWDYGVDVVERVDAHNRRVMDYCMNTYRLLFLGMLKIDEVEVKLTEPNDIKMFKYWKDGVNGLTVVSESAEEVVYKEPKWTGGVTVTPSVMKYNIRIPSCREEDRSEEKMEKLTLEAILMATTDSCEHSRYFRDDTSDIYEITEDTIANTELLMKHGHVVELDYWCKDLGALKARLKNGERLFGLTMNQGGDGMNATAIYALDGWDSDFNTYANVEILHTEVM